MIKKHTREFILDGFDEKYRASKLKKLVENPEKGEIATINTKRMRFTGKVWHDMCLTQACMSLRDTGIHDKQKTQYCITCAKTCHSTWYSAYLKHFKCIMDGCKQLKRHTSQYCIKCEKIADPVNAQKIYDATRCNIERCINTRCHYTFDVQRTEFCITHARQYDQDWFAIYRDVYECKQEGCTNLRALDVHNGDKTQYCMACAKQCAPDWYAIHHNNNRCKTSDCIYRRRRAIYGDLKTDYCLTCSKLAAPEWYTMQRKTEKCLKCTNVRCAAATLDGLTTSYCLSCAKQFHSAWYSAHRLALKCTTPTCVNIRKSTPPGGSYCVQCSETCDPLWYDVYHTKLKCTNDGCVKFRTEPALFCAKHMPGYVEKRAGISKPACEFFDYLELMTGKHVQHCHIQNGDLYGDEYRIRTPVGRQKRVDGWIQSENTVIEFLGSYWHGDPDWYDRDDINVMCKKTFGELYDKTMFRMEMFVDLGYTVYYIWESEYQEWIKTQDGPLPLTQLL